MRLLRQLDLGRSLGAFTRDRMLASSAVGLITMPRADPPGFLNGGRVLQRLWLTAGERSWRHLDTTRCGIALQPMAALPFLLARLRRGAGAGLSEAHARELERLRVRHDATFDSANRGEVMLFRLFRGGSAEVPSLRRPPGDILTLASA